jgi:hypothetical protein
VALKKNFFSLFVTSDETWVNKTPKQDLGYKDLVKDHPLQKG